MKCFRVAPICERSEYKMEIKKYWGGRGGPQAYQTMYSSLTMKLSHSLFPSCCCESRPIAVARSGRPCHTFHVLCKACGIVTNRLLLHLPASITTQNFCKLERKNDTQRTLQTQDISNYFWHSESIVCARALKASKPNRKAVSLTSDETEGLKD